MLTQLKNFYLQPAPSYDENAHNGKLYFNLEGGGGPGVCVCPGCQNVTLPILRRIGYRIEERGFLTIIHQPDHSAIVVLLNAEGRAEMDEWKEDEGDDLSFSHIYDLWEGFLCNGWSSVPEDYSFCVTPDGASPDNGTEHTLPGCWEYAYGNAAVRLEIEVLDEQNFIVMAGFQQPPLTLGAINRETFEDFSRLVYAIDLLSIDEDGITFRHTTEDSLPIPAIGRWAAGYIECTSTKDYFISNAALATFPYLDNASTVDGQEMVDEVVGWAQVIR